jgi:L,D-transpeptidase catalytic domain
MSFKTIIGCCAAIGIGIFTTSCTTTPKGGGGLAAYQKLPTNPRNVRVKVSLSKQRTYVMEGSEILLSMPVCVGSPGASTPAGNFSIMSKNATYRANSHGYAYKGNRILKTMLSSRPSGYSFKGTPMPFWCEFKANYGFHTGWVKHSPASHGCIRMHENLAPKFFRLVSIGTPVNIAYSQPEDALVGSIPLPPDAGPLPDYPGSMYLTDGYFKQYRKPIYQ